MATRPEVVKQSDLLNRLVLDRTTLEELGRVEVVWMYPQTHRVLGFICKAGVLGSKKTAFKLNQIHIIGDNGILTEGSPEATDADQVSKLESPINCELWSETGNKAGKITDCLFNLQSGEITRYLFASNGWAGIAGDVYQLHPSQVVSFGRQRVLVKDNAAKNATIYQEGIHHKVTEAGDFVEGLVKDNYAVAQKEWRSLTQQAQDRKKQAQEQLEQELERLREQAQDQAQTLSKAAQERLNALNQQLQNEAQTLAQQAKNKGQAWWKQVQQQMQQRVEEFRPQDDDEITTLTVPARAIPESVTPRPSQPPKLEAGSATPPHDVDSVWEDEDWEADAVNNPPQSSTVPETPPENQSLPEVWDDDDEWEQTTPVIPQPPQSQPSPPPENQSLPEVWDDDDEWEQDSITPQPPQPQPPQPQPVSEQQSHEVLEDWEDDDWEDEDWEDDPVSSSPQNTPVPNNQASAETWDDDDDEPWI